MFPATKSMVCENSFEKNSEAKQRSSENISVKFRHFKLTAERAPSAKRVLSAALV
jgi:hypothetical protein